MKKIFKILAVTAAAACVLGAAGCSSSDSGISLDSFWYVDNYAGIQSSAIGTQEVLVYDVTLDEDSRANSSYYITLDVSKTHSYTTTFGVADYDWNTIGYTDYQTDKTETVYYLETELYYSGTFVYGDTSVTATADNSVAFDNTVTTLTYFRSARNKLTPVYSESYVHSTSPNAYTATGVSNMCVELEYQYKVYYNYGTSEATYFYTPLTNNTTSSEAFSKTVSLSSDYTLFDNNEVYTAIRGMNLSSDFSETISLLIPADGGITNVSISCSSTDALDDTENSTIYNALVSAYKDPETTDDDGNEVINYNIVNITNAADTYSGVTQTSWYAAVEDENDNQYRATLLYLAIPMSYDLGTLEYTLSDVVSTIAPDKSI